MCVECQILQDIVSVLHRGPLMDRITCEVLPEHKGVTYQRIIRLYVYSVTQVYKYQVLVVSVLWNSGSDRIPSLTVKLYL
jgi:hypothetical protein